MLGWCAKCRAVAIDGLCSLHGPTRPLSHVSAVDVHPLTPFEKTFFNQRMRDLTLGDGLFLIYGDRLYRRKIITLDSPLAEVRLVKNEVAVTPLTTGEVCGMEQKAFVATNATHLNRLVKITRAFAQCELEHSKNALISFSGGKDSVVLADVLSSCHLPKVFIDTRLEFPETYSFISSGAGNGSTIDIARAKSDFFQLCKEQGFPRHGHRWCCKTQKFAPFAQYLSEKYDGQEVTVLNGERRWEGMYRMTQPLRKVHKHIPSQQTVQPLLDWLALDVWCYIWSKGLPFNGVYEYYDRAGCWLCPFGLEFRVFLLRFTHPKLYASLVKIGGVSSRALEKASVSEAKGPCTMEMNGKLVKTCNIFGHMFLGGVCFRCGALESSVATPSPSLAT